MRMQTLLLAATVAGTLGRAAEPAGAPALRRFRDDPPDMPPYTLPDPLRYADGSAVASAEEWIARRRGEVLELFREHVYGRVPAAAQRPLEWKLVAEQAVPSLKATWRRIALTARHRDRELTFSVSLFTPEREGPVPLVLLICNRTNVVLEAERPADDQFWPVPEILGRGYATAAYYVRDVDPDRPDGFARGVRGLFAEGDPKPDDWGTLAAWAWAASRIVDVLAGLPAIDGGRIAVVGHSRGGKTALWAAAQDERFALACVNESGCGGANILRRRFPGRETVEIINRGFPHWFNANFKTYANREHELPVDHHMLIALVAPRWVHVGSAEEDIWADPRGEFLGAWHAGPVYRLLGRAGLPSDQMPPIGEVMRGDGLAYHIRAGPHNLTLEDWRAYLDTAAIAFREPPRAR
ncbi:MAG: acetylxylan esterase [Kiritimatiellae bacterium]|nr:acetylxylan esterase [Kiritimatiellia bacterium]